MPYLWGKENIQNRLIDNLHETFDFVRNKYRLSEGDFPNIEGELCLLYKPSDVSSTVYRLEFKAVLHRMDFSTFPLVDKRTLNKLQDILLVDVPRIIQQISGVHDEEAEDAVDSFGDLDARAELILKRSAVNLFTMEERKGSAEHSTALLIVLALLLGISAVVAASFLDNHRIFTKILEALTKQ